MPAIRVVALLAAAVAGSAAAQTPAWQDLSLPFERRAADLVGRMTLEEKIFQMMDRAPAIDGLGIPEYNWWNEGLHGVARSGLATVFPQAIGFAATWDDSLVFRMATVISDEFRAKHHDYVRRGEHQRYQGLTVWSPNINLFRDPRWGRGQETYGEDPYLTGRLAVPFIRGLQGEDPRYLKTIATVKHFAVHSGPEPLRHQFDAVVSERDLRESYLPHFEAGIREAGAYSLMCAYNRVFGAPACGSDLLLKTILRGEWHFPGYVVSDCGAIDDIYQRHRVAPTAAAAARPRNDRGHRAERRPVAHAARQLQRNPGGSGDPAAGHPRGGRAAHARPVRARLRLGGRLPRARSRPRPGPGDRARAARPRRGLLRQPHDDGRPAVSADRLHARRPLGRGCPARGHERR